MSRVRTRSRQSSLHQSAVQDSSHTHDAWPLLLEHLFASSMTTPDQGLISKLLCCSKGMANLVHSTCTGRVVLTVRSKFESRPEPSSTSYQEWLGTAEEEASLWSRWLAKHARLIKCMALSVWQEQEAAIAAGLRAAAGTAAPATTSTCRTTRSQAKLVAAAEAAAAARPAAALPGLLLQQVCHARSQTPALLLSTACSSLHELQVMVPRKATFLPQHAQALAQLTSLQDFTLMPNRATDLSMYCAAFHHLTRLTKLNLLNSGEAPLQQQDISLLPPSLVELQAVTGIGASEHNGLDCRHLTALRSLCATSIEDGLLLAPSTTVLEALQCLTVAPVLQLQHLRSLRVWLCSFVTEDLQQLAAMPALQELHLAYAYSQAGSGPLLDSIAAAEVPQLRSLEVAGGTLSAPSVAALGRLTQLSSLMLLCRQLDAPPQQLLSALSKLKGLQHLAVLPPREFGPAAGEGQHDPWDKMVQGLERLLEASPLLKAHGGLKPAASLASAVPGAWYSTAIALLSQLFHLPMVHLGKAPELTVLRAMVQGSWSQMILGTRTDDPLPWP